MLHDGNSMRNLRYLQFNPSVIILVDLFALKSQNISSNFQRETLAGGRYPLSFYGVRTFLPAPNVLKAILKTFFQIV